jgi:polyphosphate kinase
MAEPALRAAGEGTPNRDPDLFVNRELSFLEFNQRIVDEAADPKVPLLERLKFISIVGANLDEFFMVRVAGLKQQLKSNVLEAGPDRMLPQEQLSAIGSRVEVQLAETERILLEDILPALTKEGIRLLQVAELPTEPRRALAAHFERQIFPMLTPLAVDPGHPFPFLKNRTLNLAVHLVPDVSEEEDVPLLAVVQVPQMLPRFVDVDMPGHLAVVFLEDVITHHVGSLFPGMRIRECVPIRVIRNWDLSFDEDEQEDLLDTVQKELRRRWRLDAVRLEIASEASKLLQERLRAALELDEADLQRYDGPLALADLVRVQERVGRSDLRDELFEPVLAPVFREQEDLFTAIAGGDVLLHHPYESYEPVVALLQQAARDPQVMAIKQTLYRVNRQSPLLQSLVEAAQNGKQVTALVELKARFDEEVNVEWARSLEQAGVHVVYGMIGLKTHCKVTLVVRKEAAGMRSYVHLGTGNYNEKTAKTYADLSYFTCRPDVGEDMSAFFNLLTGYSAPPAWKKLVVAPIGLRKHVLAHIEATAKAAKAGQPAKIVIKSNALIDAETIRALRRASQAGVQVILLIRGPCALRVGIPGVSEGIVVRFIVDRFLEHSRILYFVCGDREEVLITSTDMMPRNFDRRVEVLLPIEDEPLKRRIVDEILGLEMADNTKATELMPNGEYERVRPGRAAPVRAQAELIRRARRRAEEDQKKGAEKKKRKKDRGR